MQQQKPDKRSQRRRWLSSGRTGRLWHIRPEGHLLKRVADEVGVKYDVRYPYDYPVGGRGSPLYYFDAYDVYRVALSIVSGEVEVDPTWRTDTPEGRKIHRRRRIKLFVLVTGSLSPLIVVVVYVIVSLLR